MYFHLKILLIFVVINLCSGQQPADKGANAKTKEILDFIVALPKQGKFLSGQFGGWSNVSFNLTQMNEIANLTGHVPCLLGCNYANGHQNAIPPQNLINYACNQYLKDHWNKHGLVTVELHIPNPASVNGGDIKNRANLTFTDVLKPETETGQRWRSYIDIVAEGLDDLQQSNVTVLFRPLHEMNGAWFWWGQQDPSQFKNVWISLFDYFTNEKHLHNLLWVYAPDQGAPKPSMYYAGDDYVDIVAVDAYIDNPTSMKGYEEMIKLNKPFALGEVGPHTLNGQFDYSLWPTTIETLFNLTTYFYAWSGPWSPIENKNAYALFNNRHVINRDQM